MLDAGPRRLFRAALGCDDVDWARGKAWALEQALGVAAYYETTNPPMSRMGVRTISRLSADHSGS